MFNIARLIYLTFKDLTFKKDGMRDISGIWVYVGDFGTGKTASAVREAKKLSDEGFNVYANFDLTFKNGFLNHWKDILDVPDNSVIFLDELGETFNSRSWQSMPRQVFSHLIQVRKRNIRILATAQEIDDVDKTIRGKSKYLIKCSKLGRLITNRYYDKKGFYVGVTKRRPLFNDRFILEDYFSDYYNTNEFVEIMKGMSKEEKKTS